MEDFIDRQVEQEIFAQLLELKDQACLLTIQDAPGMGKSHLLRQLEYNCLWGHPPKPASLVLLDEKDTVRDPFTLIQFIRNEFGRSLKMEFRKFDELDKARMLKNPKPFKAKPDVGIVDLTDAEVKGHARVAGKYVEVKRVDKYYEAPEEPPREAWANPAYEKIAREECIDAFFEDLKTVCEKHEQPLVILLDAWEQCDENLSKWILIDLLRDRCFDVENRPDKLVFVLAGDQIPNFESMLGRRYKTLVKSIKALSEWEEDHIKDFLKVHGYEGISDDDFQFICGKIRAGWSPASALKMARLCCEGT